MTGSVAFTFPKMSQLRTHANGTLASWPLFSSPRYVTMKYWLSPFGQAPNCFCKLSPNVFISVSVGTGYNSGTLDVIGKRNS